MKTKFVKSESCESMIDKFSLLYEYSQYPEPCKITFPIETNDFIEGELIENIVDLLSK